MGINDIFAKAISKGWRPQMDQKVKIRDDAKVTWFVQPDIYVVPSDKGTVQLEVDDLHRAKAYLKEINNGR